MLELELLHNFTTKTYTTLTTDSSVWSFWRDDVVQLGLTCDYIMRAVLAVSALHLASQRPDRRDFYVAEGILLHQKASRAAMHVMATEGDKIDKDQGANLFLFSMLTLFFGNPFPPPSSTTVTNSPQPLPPPAAPTRTAPFSSASPASPTGPSSSPAANPSWTSSASVQKTP